MRFYNVQRTISQDHFLSDALTVKVPNLAGTTTVFRYGDLISNIINFLVIALVVFFAYKQLSKYNIIEDKKGRKEVTSLCETYIR